MERTDKKLITVWIIEDKADYRETLVKALASTPDIQCTQAFGDCESALAWLTKNKNAELPDVLLLDHRLPGLSGIEGIQYLKPSMLSTHIVMLTIVDKTETIYKALAAGASGYLVKSASISQITAAIREAAQGGTLMPADVAAKVLGFFKKAEMNTTYKLTPRETEVLQEMADGYSQKQIADRLFVSPSTVNTHIQHIYEKLHVHSSIEAVSLAIRKRIVK